LDDGRKKVPPGRQTPRQQPWPELVRAAIIRQAHDPEFIEGYKSAPTTTKKAGFFSRPPDTNQIIFI
jgi:hypothetical protein